MDYLFAIFAAPAIAAVVLSAGIVMTRGPREDLRSAINESLIWGGGMFLSYGVAIVTFELVLAA